jgi:hypothetical protein
VTSEARAAAGKANAASTTAPASKPLARAGKRPIMFFFSFDAPHDFGRRSQSCGGAPHKPRTQP